MPGGRRCESKADKRQRAGTRDCSRIDKRTKTEVSLGPAEGIEGQHKHGGVGGRRGECGSTSIQARALIYSVQGTESRVSVRDLDIRGVGLKSGPREFKSFAPW
jgi:hypothetical protein